MNPGTLPCRRRKGSCTERCVCYATRPPTNSPSGDRPALAGNQFAAAPGNSAPRVVQWARKSGAARPRLTAGRAASRCPRMTVTGSAHGSEQA
ncbi:hypothetical protein GCM10010289_79330 [Streptomyces violascens]|nr:hypothetical protein GCM10010289_79330 [Streptomyces violascens]